jgi:DNA-binding CsgD family transcriptional regulator
MTAEDLDAGRSAFARRAWAEAFGRLRDADSEGTLLPGDLVKLATAAYLVGDDGCSIRARTRAHAAFLEQGDPLNAGLCACHLSFLFLADPAQRAQGAGWLAKARRVLEPCTSPCVEQGWLMCATAFQRVTEGDPASARSGFADAADCGARFGDADLVAFARHGEGRALLRLGDTAAGLSLLDEAMAGITGGEVGPMVAGVVYCSVISACHDLFDLRRAQEWTTALHDWCDAQPDIVPFRGHCLVRRAELLLLHGSWQEALAEARRACDRLTSGRPRDAGSAYYQLGELHRLTGEYAAAGEAYRLANQSGLTPYPGLALLRHAQGELDSAETAIRLALQEPHPPRQRIHLLAAAVEILLARGDTVSVRPISEELTALAAAIDAPFVRGLAAHSRGAVSLASDDAAGSLAHLREAWSAWEDIDAPYQLARTRLLVGAAYREIGDRDGALLEFDAAHEIFEKLGATPDTERAARLAAGSPASSGGLTGREIEVLRLLATGVTNRAIAARLGISEKTVARHLSNIFTKLDLPSRAAATAYVYEHKLL